MLTKLLLLHRTSNLHAVYGLTASERSWNRSTETDSSVQLSSVDVEQDWAFN